MVAGVGVRARVPVRRRIAARRDAAGLTGPEVNPAGTNPHACFAHPHLRWLDGGDCRDVRTFRDHDVGYDGLIEPIDELVIK